MSIILRVSSPEEAKLIIDENFSALRTARESVSLDEALGRVLAGNICSLEDVPSFDRSTVDGYAVHASDTFGASSAIPALLKCTGEVLMGKHWEGSCVEGECVYVPTGGQLPCGADAVVMIEHVENYGDGTIGITQSVAPGQNVIFKGDDVKSGHCLLKAGTLLHAHDIGALAAIGQETIKVALRPLVGIISTGDELIPIGNVPKIGEIRDVNSHLLGAAVSAAGAQARVYAPCADQLELLKQSVSKCAKECDMVIVSGGTSVGIKDAAPRIIQELGKLCLHGIAIKPGKPTLVGEVYGKPVFCLPGHPVAAYLVFRTFAEPIIHNMLGQAPEFVGTITARLACQVPSNHGREELVTVKLSLEQGSIIAHPLMGKSGLITRLADTDGYIRIPRDQEGIPANALVSVIPY